MIELSFLAGLLDSEFGAAATVVQSGSLDLMKKMWEKHDQLTEPGAWMKEWLDGMTEACRTGNLAVLQWMVEHPSGRAAVEFIHSQEGVTPGLYYAADGGHLDSMQYLVEQGLATDFGSALLCAIRRGNVDAVKWLV